MTRSRTRRPVVSAALTVLLLGAGTLATESIAFASVERSAPRSVPAKKKKPTVKVATTALGKIVVTTKGFSLYVFDPDGTDTVSPKCIDACADAWPAYVAKKKPKAGKGLDQSLLGVGGGGQVTYNSHLLYTFSGDKAPGETAGQDVGGVWHLMGADGNPLVTGGTTSAGGGTATGG